MYTLYLGLCLSPSFASHESHLGPFLLEQGSLGTVIDPDHIRSEVDFRLT
jgi:hypothetical protein